MALEARWAASQPVAIDHRPRIDELERQWANLIGAIKFGGLAVELTEELKTVTAELARVQTLQTAARPKVPKAPETGSGESSACTCGWPKGRSWLRRWWPKFSPRGSGYIRIRMVEAFSAPMLRLRFSIRRA